MSSPFHPGELAVQARAHVLADAARVGGIVRQALPASAPDFLAGQRFAILAAAAGDGRVWASLVSGAPGVLRAPAPDTLHVAARLAGGDPLATALAGTRDDGALEVGVLVIDLATRKRLRVNGPATLSAEGDLVVHVRQAYWNCPKYIQRRLTAGASGDDAAHATDGPAPDRSPRLTDAQRARIAAADTFFIASAHPRTGADASHRGGTPGFVRVSRDAGGHDVVVFPDYAGNDMFNTFGNLAVSPAAGLLFVDFERGSTLQLTGAAEVLWDPAQYAALPGAERAVRFRVAEAIERPHATALRWRLVEPSPFNPPAA